MEWEDSKGDPSSRGDKHEGAPTACGTNWHAVRHCWEAQSHKEQLLMVSLRGGKPRRATAFQREKALVWSPVQCNGTWLLLAHPCAWCETASDARSQVMVPSDIAHAAWLQEGVPRTRLAT